MIKRFYFMTYQTGMVNGSNIQGSINAHHTSWLPQPRIVLDAMTDCAKVEVGGRPFCITSFNRVG